MQNKRTFISFIGKGRLDKENSPVEDGYLRADYDFGDGLICSSRCFAEAVRRSGKFKFDEVVFIGTDTSSWSTLLESCEESEAELYLKLYDRELDRQGLLAEDQSQLQTILTQVWGKPVRICRHAPELLSENSAGIFNTYIEEIFAAGNDILLDITHSFRWMPLLLTSALQFKNAYEIEGESSKFEIIYGELRTNALSPVRWLDELVKGQETTDAIALFFQKFEAEPLAEKLEPYWSAGAKIIRKLSNHIQGNYFLPLLLDNTTDGFKTGQPVNQLGNTLKKFTAESAPAWVKHIHAQLQYIYDQLAVEDSSRRFINLAELLAKRKLYGQAILNICLAAEQAIILAYCPQYHYSKHPGYIEFDRLKKEFRSKIHYRANKLLSSILEPRNQVAHGGLPNESTKNIKEGSLVNQYKQMLSDYMEFDKFLQEEFIP